MSFNHRRRRPVLTLLAILLIAARLTAAEPDHSKVPGSIIAYSPQSSGKYIGSPGIAIIGDGVYLAKHDEFGPKTREHIEAITHLYRSEDRGKTWTRTHTFEGLFWASIFTHREGVYLLGTSKHHGNVVLFKSTDKGRTWSTPKDGATGLLLEGEYHTAPMPVILHKGRIWRTIEDAMGGTQWGIRYRAAMMSAPVDADLLKRESWTISNIVSRDPKWLSNQFTAWLEGNAVVDPKGGIVNILRTQISDGGKAAIVRISDDGKTAAFDPDKDFIDFPGGAKKFAIRHDEQSKRYWSLANHVPAKHQGQKVAGSLRNTLALTSSTDLRKWEVNCIVLYHPDIEKHAFQYVDWLVEGDDLIVASRTAFDDGVGGAHNAHDANYLTFHRIEKFRTLTLKDSVVDVDSLARPEAVTHNAADFQVKGTGFSIAPLKSDGVAFGNRKYVWKNVPVQFNGWLHTRTQGGELANINVHIKKDTTIHFATAGSQSGLSAKGWEETDQAFGYTDSSATRMKVYRRACKAGKTITIPQGNWTGGILLFPPSPNQ